MGKGTTDSIPMFDPNKPFKPIKEEAPPFDPDKPFTSVKKKETPWYMRGSVSESGGAVGSSAGQSGGAIIEGIKNAFKKPFFTEGKLPDSETQQAIKNNQEKYANPEIDDNVLKEDPIKAFSNYYDAVRLKKDLTVKPSSESTGQQRSLIDRKMDIRGAINKIADDELNVRTADIIPDIKTARQWVYREGGEKDWENIQPDGMKDPLKVTNNLTTKYAADILQKADSIKKVISDSGQDYTKAAWEYYKNSDPQYQTLAKRGWLPPQKTLDKLTWKFLNDRFVKELAHDDNDIDYIKYRNERDNFKYTHEDIWQDDILQKIAQGREDYGFNNPILNSGNNIKTAEKVLQLLIQDGKADKFDMDFFRDKLAIKMFFNQVAIPTPGLVENTVSSTFKTIADTPKAITELTGIRNLYTNPAERTFERLKEGEDAVPYQPKGLLNQMGYHGGGLAGFVIPIAGEAKLLQGANLIKNATVAHEFASFLNFYHGIYQENEKANPEGGIINNIAANIQSAAFVKLTPFLGKITGPVLKQSAPEVNEILNKLRTETITADVAQKSIQNVVMDKIAAVSGETVSGAGQMALGQMVSDAVGGVFTGKYDFDESVNRSMNAGISMLYGLPLLNMIKPGSGNKPALSKIMFEMTERPEETKAQIQRSAEEDPEFAKIAPDILKNLDRAVSIREALNEKEGLSQKQKEEFLFNEVKKSILEKKIEDSPSKILEADTEKQIAETEIAQMKVLNPEMSNTSVVQEFYDNDLLPKGLMESLEVEGKFSEAKVGEFLKGIAQQTNNLNSEWEPNKDGLKHTPPNIPEQLIELANERWKKEIESAKPEEEIKEPEAPKIKGTPEDISQPIELSVEPITVTEGKEQAAEKTETNEKETIPEGGNTDKQSEQQNEKVGEPVKESEADSGGAKTPPGETVTGGGEGKLSDKGILNRLYEAKNVPEASKAGFKEKGLKYVPQSHEEAAELGKAVVKEFGVDDAILMAEAGRLKGGVRSAVFAEALTELKRQEDAAKKEEQKFELAKKFADIGIRYDEFSREQGRDISQIGYFYEKSPLGVVMMENKRRGVDFENWAKPKDKSWQEFFTELMKEPEFEKKVTAKVKEELKKERAEARKTRIAKVDKFFDDAIDKSKGGVMYSTIIPPQVYRAALEGMKKAYHAGEKVAELIENAIDHISAAMSNAPWDKDKFRKEWEEKLKEKVQKQPLIDAELKEKVLNRFRNKLKGLTEKEKDEVIRRAHKELIENGALDYEDFRRIISRVTGKGEMTPDEAAKMKELVGKTNALDEAAKTLREQRTDAAYEKFNLAELDAAKASKELNELFYNKPDVVKRLVSVMQLNTLGIPSLINNPIYNIWNQATLRFPIGVINDVIDRGIAGVAKMFGKNYQREYNVFETQKEFWRMLGVGAKESAEQIGTGLNRVDYTQKEVYSETIRPFRSMRDLVSWSRGNKKLTRAQVMDKAIQSTAGVPAEIVARLLNIGDKPQRFAAEGSQASAFAKSLGLKDMDYKLFIDFPREEAYREYKAQGFSDAEAGQKADYVRDAIIKEGQRSTFQQDNLLNDILARAFGVFGGKESGTANLVKVLTVSPYVKIPSNAFWSFYNLLNPEVAMLQSMIHGGRAKYFSGKTETTKSKLAMREARYWMGHAIVGIASRAVVIALVKQGVFTPGSDADDQKKERDAAYYFDKPGTTQVGDLKISNRWFGQWGMLANQIAKRYYDATPEQRANMDDFWHTAFGGMEVDGLKELQNGVFSNSSSILQAMDSGDPNRYLTNTVNMFSNIIQPAAIAQINRAALGEVPTSRGDGLLDQINQQFAQRSALYRWATNTEINKKRDIWGNTIPKGGNMAMRLFGISKANPQIFARPIYDDYLKTGDAGFLPPAVLQTLNGQKLNTKEYDRLQEYVGNERKRILEPYINGMAYVPEIGKTYSQMTDSEKKEVLAFLYSEGREKGLVKFYSDFPKLKPKEKTDIETEQDDIMKEAKKAMKEQQ